MEKELMIKKLNEAKNSSTKIQLMFVYPDTKPIFRTGYVKNISKDAVEFEDKFNGLMTFGLEFLEEIRELKGGEE